MYLLLYVFYLMVLPSDDNRHEHEYLIQLAQTGDRNAFEKIAAIYAPKIKSFLSRETPSYLEVEDVVQEAMVRLFTSIKNFRFESTLTTFLIKIARRALAELIRKHPSSKGIRTFSEMKAKDNDEDIVELIQLGVNSEDIVITNEFNAKIEQALSELSQNHREVIALCLIHELGRDEVADILNESDGTIKSRLFRARQELKKKLKNL